LIFTIKLPFLYPRYKTDIGRRRGHAFPLTSVYPQPLYINSRKIVIGGEINDDAACRPYTTL